MSTACVKHPMTIGDDICSSCGHMFCTECIVFPFGADRPGLCIACALERGGVRARATRWPRLPRRTVRERLRTSRRDATQDSTSDQDSATDQDVDTEPVVESWLGDDDPIEGIPGAWSATYR